MPAKSAHGKICYVEIPAHDIPRSASFYNEVFGWQSRTRGDGALAFDDGAGEVSGAWVKNRPPNPSPPGLLTYIMVDDMTRTLDLITTHGGKITQPVGRDHPEITARFTDPDGNLWGLYQEPR